MSRNTCNDGGGGGVGWVGRVYYKFCTRMDFFKQTLKVLSHSTTQGEVAESKGLLFMPIFSSAVMKCPTSRSWSRRARKAISMLFAICSKVILCLLKIAKFVTYKSLIIK